MNDSRAGRGDGVVLLARPAANADRSDYLTALLERYSSCKDHDASMVRDMDTEELTS